MKRLPFLHVLFLFAAAGLVLMTLGWAGQSSAAAQEPSQRGPYTATSFGPWNAAVAKTHVPEVTYEKAGTALTVNVKVDNHPMDAQKPHFIQWIRVEDGNGKLLAKKIFKPTDPAPAATFHLASIPEKLKVLDHCNVHGTWLNEVDVKLP